MNLLSINNGALCLMLALSAVGVQSAYASEESKRPASGNEVPSDFTASLKDIDRQLAEIEGVANKMHEARNGDQKDAFADDLESKLSQYSKEMFSSFRVAIQQANLAQKSGGRRGSIELLHNYEDLASNHERRLATIDKVLQPEGGKPVASRSSNSNELSWRVGQVILNVLVPPAEAAIALSVNGACQQNPRNQVACTQAISNGNSLANSAQSQFAACWGGYEGTRPKAWRAVKRLGCSAALVARLA